MNKLLWIIGGFAKIMLIGLALSVGGSKGILLVALFFVSCLGDAAGENIPEDGNKCRKAQSPSKG